MASLLHEILLASSPDGTITAFDASGTTLARFTGSRSPRKGLVVIENNLIAASHISSHINVGSMINLYNWWSSTPSRHLPVSEPVGPLSATSDGYFLFAGGVSGQIHAMSLPSGDPIRTFPAHNHQPVSCLTINDDGSLLFSGGDDGTIAVFAIFKLLDISISDNSTEKLVLHRFGGHESTVTSISSGIGGSNCTIISCSLDCTCKFWSLVHGTHLRTIAFPCSIWVVEMDSTETEFFAAGSDGFLYSGALKGGDRNMVKQGGKLVKWDEKTHGGAIVALATTNGGRNLATASENGSILIWDVLRREVVKVVGEEMGSVSELVVAKGFGNGEGKSEERGWSLGLCSEEVIGKPMREVVEMEKVFGALEEDRRRAVGTLGSAIETYEKLLELILKEGKRGRSCDGSSGEGGDDM